MPFSSDDQGSPSGGFGSSGAAGAAVGALGLIGGLYDSHQNRKVARENTDKTIAAQKAEAELAYQRSVEMWNMQNLYNTPEAQMNRFKAAGLNPNLIYGQGNAGNAANIPNYQPPSIQYRYAAGNYGSSIASVLPTLMSVGTWLQNMRLGEAELLSKRTNTEKAQQMVDYLTQMNPKLLEEKENKLSLYPYQYQAQRYSTDLSRQKLFEMEQEFRYKFGEDLFGQMGSSFDFSGAGGLGPIGGTKRLDFLLKAANTKLKEAQASWTDFGITSPQSIMQLVLSGVMGLAGQTLKARPSMFKGSRQSGTAPKRIKTFYEKGRRRSQVVDFD